MNLIRQIFESHYTPKEKKAVPRAIAPNDDEHPLHLTGRHFPRPMPTHLHQDDQTNLDTNNAKMSWNIKQKQSEVKRVQFKSTVEVNQNSSSPQLKSILGSKIFKAKSPSTSLRKRLNEKLVLKLDEEMKEILFTNKE
ncbi:hypothetical protein J6590_025497 [Homalodisca vitripennis]|nr:hypothetical protein J6590_025497 [Homalodisca vitripennis]